MSVWHRSWMTVPEQRVQIVNKLGLHARASAMFVQVATRYESDVYVQKDAVRINGKSIMGVMMLASAKDSELLLITEGRDAREALDALVALVADKFGEAE